MPRQERATILEEIRTLREGRIPIAFFNFDRSSAPPLPGLSLSFDSGTKEALFRVLKESCPAGSKIDLILYTRGGDTNAVWPLVSLLREYDANFEVLVPFRAHSAGTLVAMSAKKILMGPLSELSPIDPTTGNQFNPTDSRGQRLGISVEDVVYYINFVKKHLQLGSLNRDTGESALADADRPYLTQFVQKLAGDVHPLAIGNVERVHRQIQRLAKRLLDFHPLAGVETEKVVNNLASQLYSHLHMINRHEAKEILGDKVAFADDALAVALDKYLRQVEHDFGLRSSFFVANYMGDELMKTFRFAGGIIESGKWGYIHATEGRILQSSQFPANVTVQLPPGQRLPLVPGLPRNYQIEVLTEGWENNLTPKGVTI